jgi:hypothetical protein
MDLPMAHSPYPSAADDLDEDIFGDEDEDIFGDEDEDILGDEDEDILGLDDDDDDLLGDDDDDLLGDDDDDDDLLGDDDDDDDLLGDDDYDLLGDDDDDLLGDDATDALERDVDTYGLGHDDDDMWDDMMHQADSGPQGYSATALSYMSPVEVEDDLLSPYALQQLDPMGEFGGDEDDDEDEFAAEMEIEELEEFGIVGVIATTAFALVLGPVALTAAVAAPMGLAGALGALAGPKKKYMRVAARLARLAEKDKTKTAKWARNVGRLRATWRRLKKKGKTGGMQSPNTILKALRGGSRSPVFQQAARVQQSGAAGTPTASISSHDKAQLQRRRQQRRRQQNRMRRQKQQAYQQQQSRQSQQPRRSRQGYPQSSQRSGIRPHQMREMQRAQQQTNFARRSGRTGPQATIGKPPTGYTPTSISQGEQRDIWEKGLRASRAQGGGGQQGGGQQRGLSRRNQYGSFNNGDTQVGIPAGYTLTPNFGTVLKEHPFKSILALGGIFAAGVMLSTPTKNMVSGLTDRYRG